LQQLGYQARWVSKGRADALKRSGQMRQAVLVDSLRGYIVVEPSGSGLGDGRVLSDYDADVELSDSWCLLSKARLAHARRLLGLRAETATP
jgi:hypothetical protein